MRVMAELRDTQWQLHACDAQMSPRSQFDVDGPCAGSQGWAYPQAQVRGLGISVFECPWRGDTPFLGVWGSSPKSRRDSRYGNLVELVTGLTPVTL